jgi:hypothetical protein
MMPALDFVILAGDKNFEHSMRVVYTSKFEILFKVFSRVNTITKELAKKGIKVQYLFMCFLYIISNVLK